MPGGKTCPIETDFLPYFQSNICTRTHSPSGKKSFLKDNSREDIVPLCTRVEGLCIFFQKVHFSRNLMFWIVSSAIFWKPHLKDNFQLLNRNTLYVILQIKDIALYFSLPVHKGQHTHILLWLECHTGHSVILQQSCDVKPSPMMGVQSRRRILAAALLYYCPERWCLDWPSISEMQAYLQGYYWWFC